MDNKSENLNERIALRPVVFPNDEEFLIALYYTTRDDIQWLPIDEEQKKNVSLMQYLAQKHHYTTHYNNSVHNIVLLDGEAVGRLWTAHYETEIVCVDVAILPEYRNRRIGTKLMLDLIDETTASKKIFNFHVLMSNTNALRFYERLNCKLTGETPTHFKMQWRPENEYLRSTKK